MREAVGAEGDFSFSRSELAMLLDAVMVLYRGVESVPENDGSELPAIAALQRKLEGLLTEPPTPSAAPSPSLADAIHAEVCGEPTIGVGGECRRYARGAGNEHWEYYQERARELFTRLEPLVGGAEVEAVVRVMLEELW